MSLQYASADGLNPIYAGGEIHPPLDLFVDNFFIVGHINL